ncbi:MAG: hypothetical protein ABI462_07320 [Ignavibacteria bacterium]
MESQNLSETKRIWTGIAIGVGLIILSAGACAMGFLMVSVLVFGCTKSPPEWLFMFVFLGLPIPLIATSIVVPYLYIKRQRTIWILFTPVVGVFLSVIIFFTFFIILTQYC